MAAVRAALKHGIRMRRSASTRAASIVRPRARAARYWLSSWIAASRDMTRMTGVISDVTGFSDRPISPKRPSAHTSASVSTASGTSIPDGMAARARPSSRPGSGTRGGRRSSGRARCTTRPRPVSTGDAGDERRVSGPASLARRRRSATRSRWEPAGRVGSSSSTRTAAVRASFATRSPPKIGWEPSRCPIASGFSFPACTCW